jgi:hypothetical protein
MPRTVAQASRSRALQTHEAAPQATMLPAYAFYAVTLHTITIAQSPLLLEERCDARGELSLKLSFYVICSADAVWYVRLGDHRSCELAGG